MAKREHRWTDQWGFWVALLTILGSIGGGIWTMSGSFATVKTEIVNLKTQVEIINQDRSNLTNKIDKVLVGCCSELKSTELVASGEKIAE